jgi:hypothetical protein
VWGNVLQVNGPTRLPPTRRPKSGRTWWGSADNDRTTLSFTADYNPTVVVHERLVTGLDVSAENNSLLYPRTPLGAADPSAATDSGEDRGPHSRAS